jgi:hypothetical protein
VIILDEEQWRPLATAHAERVLPWVAPRQERRARGERHPVDDFLFDYYPYRPGKLLHWHPGWGVGLRGSSESLQPWLTRSDYLYGVDGIAQVVPTVLEDRRAEVASTLTLLQRTRERPMRLGCFGLHEWAMVHRIATDEVRHPSWPLRLTEDEIADVVESVGLRCTHYDAFRFFTPAARPLNDEVLTRARQVETEQPGCLHASMDLYKWSVRLLPLVPSDLVADCFELARQARELDMRAAPYDLRTLGYDPIRVETPEGRVAYVDSQRATAGRAVILRDRLIDALAELSD